MQHPSGAICALKLWSHSQLYLLSCCHSQWNLPHNLLGWGEDHWLRMPMGLDSNPDSWETNLSSQRLRFLTYQGWEITTVRQNYGDLLRYVTKPCGWDRSPRSDCAQNDRPVNREMSCEGKEEWLYSESQQTGKWWTSVPRTQVRIQVSFKLKREKIKNKKKNKLKRERVWLVVAHLYWTLFLQLSMELWSLFL